EGDGLVLCLFFFFSSRRRHTRFSRDWSSDVCSSDLGLIREHRELLLSLVRGSAEFAADAAQVFGLVQQLIDDVAAMLDEHAKVRSEERRVGKEWRARWWPIH